MTVNDLPAAMAWRGSGVRIPSAPPRNRRSEPAGEFSHWGSAHHRTCSRRWRGVVSLGYAADGKRIRKKVSGQTRAEVKDKLKALHAGVRTVQGYTAGAAVADWLAEGLPGRAAKTVEIYRDALRPVLAAVGRIPLRNLTVQDVRT